MQEVEGTKGKIEKICVENKLQKSKGPVLKDKNDERPAPKQVGGRKRHSENAAALTNNVNDEELDVRDYNFERFVRRTERNSGTHYIVGWCGLKS